MQERTIALLREWQSLEEEIAEKGETPDLLRRKRFTERILNGMRGTIEGPQFECFWLHVIKGVSLSQTGKKVGYRKSSVAKIIRETREKLDTPKTFGSPSKGGKGGAKF